MAPPMPHDTIIEGLKQGNAVELELVTKMKEGLDLVTEGLMRECHNRSDALSELRERFQTVEPSAKTTLNADQKTAIQDIVADCAQLIEEFEVDGGKTRDLALEELEEMRVFNMDTWSDSHRRLRDRSRDNLKVHSILEEFDALADLSPTARRLQQKLKDKMRNSISVTPEDWDAFLNLAEAADDRLEKQKEHIQGAYLEMDAIARNMKAMLKSMAAVLEPCPQSSDTPIE